MKKVLTIIFDGFGIREELLGNGPKLAKMPTYNKLLEDYPHSQLLASEEAVGLAKNQMGNSEVGHMTIGAGRLVKQNFMQIDDMFKSGDIRNNKSYQDIVNYVKLNKKPVHIMALCSDGGIHSHIKFILNLIDELVKSGVDKIYVHAITDGRDTKTNVAGNYILELDDKLKNYGIGYVSDVCGRYYAMDRDKKWDRTKIYSDAVTKGIGKNASNLCEAINDCYRENVTDEFLKPILLNGGVQIEDGDALIWFNYRPDRAKQILTVLTDKDFLEYDIKKYENLKVLTIYPIEEAKNSLHLLEITDIENPLGVYLSKLGYTQARIAETEKYAHVTYFFDGGKEYKLKRCDRLLIPSPKVATYDLKPEMSSSGVTETCLKALDKGYDFILMNYANPDMVGHTGNLDAVVKALEVLDGHLKEVLDRAKEKGYTVFLLSDHGNSDYMIDENGNPVTTHSLFPVPFIVTDKSVGLRNGKLTEVAPTILDYMDLPLPKEMSGTKTLLVK